MAITVEATYENGVLKPVQPLPLIAEGSRLWVTLHIAAEPDRARAAYGLLGWTGDPEIVRRIAEDDEFGLLEAYDHDELARSLGESPRPPDGSPFAQGQ